MAKVANRVDGRRGAAPLTVPVISKTGKTLETKVVISTGFKDLKDNNRKVLHSLKY